MPPATLVVTVGASEVRKEHMTTGHSVETEEFLAKEPMPRRHVPLLTCLLCFLARATRDARCFSQ